MLVMQARLSRFQGWGCKTIFSGEKNIFTFIIRFKQVFLGTTIFGGIKRPRGCRPSWVITFTFAVFETNEGVLQTWCFYMQLCLKTLQLSYSKRQQFYFFTREKFSCICLRQIGKDFKVKILTLPFRFLTLSAKLLNLSRILNGDRDVIDAERLLK